MKFSTMLTPKDHNYHILTAYKNKFILHDQGTRQLAGEPPVLCYLPNSLLRHTASANSDFEHRIASESHIA